MPMPFDAATKHLVELRPADWLEYTGESSAPVDLIDADLATVTAAADKVLRVRETEAWLLHLEFQSSRDPDLSERLVWYNVLLRRRHALPVSSVVVLLRPEADSPDMTGFVEHRLPSGRRYLEFVYDVVRAWEKPVEEVLAGGLGTLPMAPLADMSGTALPRVIRRMEERIQAEASPDTAGLLWTATYVLMGLRYSDEETARLMQGVRAMKESVTYQAILREGREEGRAEEARAIVLRLGEKRFGPPSPEAQAKLDGITSIEELEQLSERLLDVESWEELLAD